MRKLVLQLAVSLDGRIEGPNGEYDWCFVDQDYGMSDFLKRIDAVFMGRKSYELVQSMGSEGMPKQGMTEYIFSTTLDQVKPGAILIKDEIESNIRKIKNEPGKDIWLFGGSKLTSSLLDLGLVDEIILAVHPIILGSGKPMVNDIRDRIALKLVGHQTYSTGMVMLTYEIQKP